MAFDRVPLLAVAHQAILSGGALGTQLFLAHLLDPSAFGIFVLIAAAVQVGLAVHAALVVFPQLMARRNNLGETATDGAAAAATLAMAGAAIWCGPIGWWLATAAIAETLRRALAARRRLITVLCVDVMAVLATWGALVFFIHGDHPYLSSALVAGGALLAAFGHAFFLYSKTQPHWLGVTALLREGIPTLPMRLLETALLPSLLAVVAWLSGTAAAAEFQVILTMLALANPVLFALGTVLVVDLRAGRRGEFIPALAYFLTIPFFLVLAVWPRQVLGWLFPLPYLGLADTIKVLSPIVLAAVFVHLEVCRLLAEEKHRQLLLLQSAGWFAAAITLLICWSIGSLTHAAAWTIAVAVGARFMVAVGVRATIVASPPP